MKYYIVIGHKKGEKINDSYDSRIYESDWIEMIERDDQYSYYDYPPGAHQLFGYLDVNFNESVQYGMRATKTQEAWLIGRHRIARMLDFGNFGYQFVRQYDTKRIQFPERITISFDKQIKDNGVNKPSNNDKKVEIELSQLNEQIIHCYDKECDIDPLVFRLAKFDNYGDAYIDLMELKNYQDFQLHIDHFVNFMKNYPNSSIFLVCPSQKEQEIKTQLRGIIQREHLTNYFEFCNPDFNRKRPNWGPVSGSPSSEYDTFSETIEEFFNEKTLNTNSHIERNFYNVPFKQATITVNNNWNVYAGSEKFKQFLQYNPSLTLEIDGVVKAQDVVEFIRAHGIKANVVIKSDPNNQEMKEAIVSNRKDELQHIISQHGYDHLGALQEEEEQENEEYRLALEKYAPQKLNLAEAQIQVTDVQVGQNQNQNQNQNQAQQMRQSNNEPYVPLKLEINNKSSIPDVNFGIKGELLKSLIGLPFQREENAPQTEVNINYLLTAMEQIIKESPASKNCYCPLSYSVEELVPGAFYVPKDRVKTLPHPGKYPYNFDENKNTLFFSPPYASIAIKKDKYAFKPYHRPTDANLSHSSPELVSTIKKDRFLNELIEDYHTSEQKQKINLLFNNLYSKRGQSGIDLLTRSLHALKLKNPNIYDTVIKHHLLTSKDFSEYVDSSRYITIFEALGKLKDQKKIDWWNKLVEIQCRNNSNFDLNHMFAQFTGFWEDIEKLQKFIPTPDQFPFDDFADAGITLGKMYRIIGTARNRFEQIKSFDGGNISHAYMLFDLFNSSMYSKEMDDYCVLLTKELTAENAFDKSKLKETHFSPKKLAELAEHPDINLQQLKSYLLVFASVNGNTLKHNNSDLAFYNALFKEIENTIQKKHFSESDKKTLYSTIMLFAAYGNNTTKERMVQDIKTFVSLPDPIKCCHDILDIYKDAGVSHFFSAEEDNRKMANSEAMLSLHTVVEITQKIPNPKQTIRQATDLIVKNKSLSLAVQKIMRDTPNALLYFDANARYLDFKNDRREQLNQSLFLITSALNQYNQGLQSEYEFWQFSIKTQSLSLEQLNNLEQLFLDIDFAKFPAKTTLFTGRDLANEFVAQAKSTQNLDELIFVLQDFDVKLTSIKPSEQALLMRIKQLENNLSSDESKIRYVMNYQDLIMKRLRIKLDPGHSVELFNQTFIEKIDHSFPAQSIKLCYESLVEMVTTTKKEDLLQIMHRLQLFSVGKTAHNVDPAPLLSVTAFILKHAYPIENCINFMDSIKENTPSGTNEKLQYLQSLFEKISDESGCYENNNRKNKLTKETTNQIKACMKLMKQIDAVDASLLGDLFARSQRTLAFSLPQYLQFLETLASPINIDNPFLESQFNLINQQFFELLQQYPDSFSDLLDITKFDAELLSELSFNSREELSTIARICKNELLLNAKNNEQPAKNYKQEFAKNIKALQDKKLNLSIFYGETQLAQPSADVLVRLLDHYNNNRNKALHHYEKDPWFKRPHHKNDMFGANRVNDKELTYQTGFFDMSKQNDVLEQITRNDSGFEKSVRRNLLFTFSTYINEIGYRLPAFRHNTNNWSSTQVPVRKLSNEELKAEFLSVKQNIAYLRNRGQDNIWQNKKYQRSMCKLLAIIREAMYRDGDKNAYSTQMDAVLLALMAGDYQYAMQINTGEGKALIAIAIAIAQQTLTAKQIIITTSNLGLASRDAEAYDRFIKWFGVTHETIAATTKDKSKLHAQIIHTTGNDFALCHGKDVLINNSNKIYLNDEYDYTMSHLTPSINSQTKPNEDENWWVYEEILAYVTAMDEKEAKKKPEQQAQGLIAQLSKQFNERIQEIRKDIAYKTHQIEQNADNKTSGEQIAAREALDKEFGERFEFYAKRLAKLNDVKTEDQFNALIDSAIIAQFVLKKGEGYEVIEQFEEGNTLKKIVPTEGGKPITEGNVMYMYGIHQFLIQKTLMEYKEAGDNSEFIKPSELESTTYFNNYSTQAGSRSIGITGTVPKEKYKMYEALIGGGKSDVIPPHQISQRIDAVPYERLNEIKKGSEHVCTTEEQLIDRLVQQIKGNDGPALIYCNNKNVCKERRDALIKQLQNDGYVVQIIIPGVTEDFTDGDKLTTLGRQAQNQKTVTLTVGDGRGIDPVPKGRDGLLTICSFVPENVEKLLQIYGRSGRNGKPGNTNLFILESELKKYGIKFDNLEEEFNFLDEIRTKEFDFAIKKIGFMQYEIQRQIRDEDKRTTVISFMDDLYNKLVLKAVADKVKHKQGNQIGSYTISGRWEPFVMLNDKELENIYEEFCVTAKNKLQDMQLYNIDIEGIKTLQDQYHQQVAQAINQEKTAQRGMDEKSVREKLENHTRTLKNKSQYSYNSTVELPDGIEINIGDWDIKQTYRQLEVNLGSYNKTISLMQKYVGTHIGIYGFIDESTYLPYEKIYELLEQQKQVIKEYQAQEKDTFYNYLIVTELSGAINLLLNDSSSDSKYYQTAVEKLFQNAERYDNMTETGKLLGHRTVIQIKQLALNYYKTGYLSYTDTYYFKDLQEQLSEQAGQAREAMAKREDTVLDRCQTIYQELQDKIYTEGTKPLSELTDRPMKDNNAKLAVLFSMLQMVTKEERNTAPVKRAVSEISKEVNPIVNEFNGKVKEFKGIIKQQRVCLELLKRIHLTRDTRTKMSKYSEMVHFDDVASKNMVAFYHDYNKVPETLQSLNTDIKEEQLYLDRLEAEVEILRLDAEAARERARQEAEAERKRLEDLRRRQEAEARRNLYLNNVRYKITSALDLLGNRINQIHHPLTEAIGVANKLLSDLRAAQGTYLERLGGALNELDLTITDFNKNPVINKINTDYIEVCEGLINNKETRSVLERDLGWGEFLSNLLKTIVNILITGVTFGTVNNFFSLEKSETIREIDEKKDHLQP